MCGRLLWDIISPRQSPIQTFSLCGSQFGSAHCNISSHSSLRNAKEHNVKTTTRERTKLKAKVRHEESQKNSIFFFLPREVEEKKKRAEETGLFFFGASSSFPLSSLSLIISFFSWAVTRARLFGSSATLIDSRLFSSSPPPQRVHLRIDYYYHHYYNHYDHYDERLRGSRGDTCGASASPQFARRPHGINHLEPGTHHTKKQTAHPMLVDRLTYLHPFLCP